MAVLWKPLGLAMAAMAATALLAQPCFEENSTSLPLQVLHRARVQVLYLSSSPGMEAELRTASVLLNCQ